MQDFPHLYKVKAAAGPDGDVSLSGDGIDVIRSAPPSEFGGPGDKWSPETLLVASVADCLVLSFRAIARASKFSWISLNCEAEGTLEREEGKARFTKFMIRATLSVPQDAKEDRAQRLLQKAEESCLITNSLSGPTHLETVVVNAPQS
jgi:peroxiredoxin-like protein